MPVNEGHERPPDAPKLRGRSHDIPGIRGLDHSIVDIRRHKPEPDTGWIFVGAVGAADNTPDSLLDEISPPFENGFSNPPDTDPTALVSFYMDAVGVVWLRGKPQPSGGVLPLTAFHLPDGYRPAASHFFVGASDPGTCIWRIDSDGSVVLVRINP